MTEELLVFDLEVTDFKTADDFQRAVLYKKKAGYIPDALIFVEHNSVFTIGRTGSLQNLRTDKGLLQQKGVEVINTDRGGDITYHGPGQLVIWPVFDLAHHKKDIGWFITNIEAVLIDLLRSYGIDAETKDGLRGVWVKDKKIGFVGIGVTKWITYHGASLNISADVNYFSLIHPCGLKNIEVTSMHLELGKTLDMETIKREITALFLRLFGYRRITHTQKHLCFAT